MPLRLSVALAFVCLVPLPLWAQFQPNVLPEMDVPELVGSIEIDGEINDSGWAQAGRATNWTETWPADQGEPPVHSETWVTYSPTHLYIAFLAYDDPDEIRATQSDRDQIWQDDYMGLILDTYGTASWAYELFLNPFGIQGDLRWTNDGEDLRFDIIFESEGKITDDGYQIEVAIPFKSLRFPEGESQTWRATFWRNRPRESRSRYSWAMMSRDNPCWPCNFGTLKGIDNVSSGSSWELLPSVVGFDAAELRDPDDAGSGLHSVDSSVEVSLGGRYALTSSVSAEGSLNPDFSQVESDAAQIDVNTTFALFFPERRPFFQEGSDLYSSWVSQVYTRSVNNPQWAGKLTGRQANSSFAFMTAQDEDSPLILPFEESSEFLVAGRSWTNILRGRRTFGEDNHIGFLGTDRRLEGGGAGSTYGADLQLRFLTNYRVEAQVIGSTTVEPDDAGLSEDLEGTFAGGDHTVALDGETFSGDAEYFSLERSARRWNFDLDYWSFSPTFRADNGFITQNNTRRGTVWTGLDFQPNNKVFDSVGGGVFVGRWWNHDGLIKDEAVRPELFAQFKGQTNASVGFLVSEERFGGKEFKGISRGSANVETQGFSWMTAGAYFEAGKSIARGLEDPVLGDAQNLSLWAGVKPTQRLNINPSYDYAKLTHPDGSTVFEGFVLRTRLTYQVTRELFLRFIVQYDDFAERFDLEPLVTYRINPFTVFFVGSRHQLEEPGDARDRVQTERQFFAKFQYLFRI